VRSNDNEFVRSQLGGLLKLPGLWLFAAITLTSYAAYSGAYYFTPYLTETGAATTEQAGLVTSLRYATFALAPLSGLVADRVMKSTSKWFVLLFTLLGIAYLGVLALPADAGGAYVTIYSFLPSLLGIAIYGVQFSVASEARIPTAVTATAIGIISMIGYTPDFFMAPLFGHWLDQYGSNGYTVIFLFLASVCLAGVLVSLALVRYSRPRVSDADDDFISVEEAPAR
jgi:nitrate/nitrite transporter NarK